MGLFSRLASPVRGYRLLRRVLVELRGIRLALERQADALELGQQPQETPNAQVFRSHARTKGDLDDRELRDLTSVAYVNDQELAGMLRAEEELRILLGRDPSEEEIERAYRGEVEVRAGRPA